MLTHIALLRGINFGGRNKVAMADLKALMVKLGFKDAKSLLQSGNLVFSSDKHTSEELEQLLEKETTKRLKVSPDYLVRSADEWRQIVARNPFPKEAVDDPSHLVVMCLKAAPTDGDVDALRAAIKGPEVVQADGRQLYAVYPAGIGDSKLTNTVIESRLKTRGSARNWNTALKLLALCG
jgi:uncharacterized protein (DUF1697 family)